MQSGASITLQDLVVGGPPVEATAPRTSLTARRGDTVAARVIRTGPSGGLALELPVLDMPIEDVPDMVEDLRRWRASYQQAHPTATETEFWKYTHPLFHLAWVLAELGPLESDL